MKPDKFTHKLQEALTEAQMLAIQSNHTLLEPIHVLKALLEQQGGIIASIITQAGGNLKILSTAIDSGLKDLATTTNSSQINASNGLIKVLKAMEKIALAKKDEFISSDLFLIAGFDDASLAKIFQSAGLTKPNVTQAVEKIRGSDHVDSQNAEDMQGALQKYTVDLTESGRKGKIGFGRVISRG